VERTTRSLRRDLRARSTDAERALWRALRVRLPAIKIRRQHGFGPYVVDFYVASARLVIELDGGQHYEPEAQITDARRTAWLEARGLRVLRFTNREVTTELESVLSVIAAAAGPSP
jgi:very-short-patch-repair endonuclease